MKRKTASWLKQQVSATGSKMFTRENMKFAGDTMRNYAVAQCPVILADSQGNKVECWKLYRLRAVKHGLCSDAFFACDDFRRMYGQQAY